MSATEKGLWVSEVRGSEPRKAELYDLKPRDGDDAALERKTKVGDWLAGKESLSGVACMELADQVPAAQGGAELVGFLEKVQQEEDEGKVNVLVHTEKTESWMRRDEAQEALKSLLEQMRAQRYQVDLLGMVDRASGAVSAGEKDKYSLWALSVLANRLQQLSDERRYPDASGHSLTEAERRDLLVAGKGLEMYIQCDRFVAKNGNLSAEERKELEKIVRYYGEAGESADMPGKVKQQFELLKRMHASEGSEKPAESENKNNKDTQPSQARQEAPMNEANRQPDSSKVKNVEVVVAEFSDPELYRLYAQLEFINLARKHKTYLDLWREVDALSAKEESEKRKKKLFKSLIGTGGEYEEIYKSPSDFEQKLKDLEVRIAHKIDRREEEIEQENVTAQVQRAVEERVRQRNRRELQDLNALMDEELALRTRMQEIGEARIGEGWERLVENPLVRSELDALLPQEREKMTQYLQDGLYWDVVDHDTSEYGEGLSGGFGKLMVSVKYAFRKLPFWKQAFARRREVREKAIKIIERVDPVTAQRLRHLTLLEKLEYGLK